MKTISDYSLFCTEEQTRKALELGAPIEYDLYSNQPHASIDFVGESGKMECASFILPTAEQMVGWIEKNTEVKRINVVRGIDDHYYWDIFTWKKIASSYSGYTDGDFSRKEATLAAIDAALEYLTNNKK